MAWIQWSYIVCCAVILCIRNFPSQYRNHFRGLSGHNAGSFNPLDPGSLILKYAPFPTSCHTTQSVSTKYGCIYFFARNFFILHFLTLQVVFILKTIELPTLWYHYNFIIVKRKKHDLHLKTKIRPKNTTTKVGKYFASAEK